MKKLFDGNRLEFIAVLGALVGIALIGLRGRVEDLLKQGYYQVIGGLKTLNQILKADLPHDIQAIPISTLIGWLLVILAVLIVIFRVRYRFSNSDRWQATQCPRCGSGLQHIHRNSIDRLLSHTLLPSAHRYQCENNLCRWSGLRRKRHHQDQPQLPFQEIINPH